MRFESATDFDRALHRCFRTSVKHQRHAVATWDFDQSSLSFGLLILIGTSNDLRQLVNRRPLFVNRKLGVTDDVNEQDVGDLELDLFLNLSGHILIQLPIVEGMPDPATNPM